jgi:ribonuclease P protein component
LRIQQGGRRVVSPGFVFMLDRSASGQAPRLGITASRRVGNAVQRNRAKRLVREAFRALRGTWPPVDVVVIVRQGLGDSTLGDVVSEWQAARGRILRRSAELTESPAPHAPRHDTSSAPADGVDGAAAVDRAEPREPAKGG